MKNLKTNWLLKHTLTVFSCVLIVAFGIAFLSHADPVTTTIGENIATNDLSVAGNVTSGTWQGTAVGTQYGGTGQDWSAVAQGNLPYFSAEGALSNLAPGTAGQFLKSQGTGADPEWTGVTRSATFVVAANDSSALSKQQADYVCDGVDDQVEIQAAIDALPTHGGKIILLDGLYWIHDTIQLRQKMEIAGTGVESTKLRAHAELDGKPMMQYTDTLNTLFTDIRDIYLYASPGRTATIGIDFQNLSGDKYLENVFIQGFTDYGVYDANGWNARFINCIFEGHITSQRGTGLYVGGNDFKIIGCKFLYNDIGCYAYGRGQIVGNFFYRNQQHGLRLVSGGNVVGNTFERNSENNSNTYSDIELYSSGVSTNNAVISANLFIGLEQKYAILPDTGSYLVQVSNNSFTGTYQTSIVRADRLDKLQIRSNYGFTTESFGTATLVNGQTSIVVTHGLDVTPSAGDIVITPIEAWGNMTQFWIDTYTSTQFTIHANIDPGQDVDFAWKAVAL